MGKQFESPEEGQKDSGDRPGRGGSGPFDGGGIAEGMHGRGSTPFKLSQSSAPKGHSIEAHMSDTGRGGSGILGKGDSFKGHAPDIAHPDTHAAFESLGVDEE